MKKEILTEEKVKQRWQQMEEMDKIWNNLSEREKNNTPEDNQKIVDNVSRIINDYYIRKSVG